jgi:hypothetical protein
VAEGLGLLGAFLGMCLGIAVVFVLTKAALSGELIQRPEPAPRKDLRHLAAVCLYPAVLAAIAIEAGAPAWGCGLAALAGLPLSLHLSRFVGALAGREGRTVDRRPHDSCPLGDSHGQRAGDPLSSLTPAAPADMPRFPPPRVRLSTACGSREEIAHRAALFPVLVTSIWRSMKG